MAANDPEPPRRRFLLSGEDWLAVMLCLMVIALIVMTSSSAPQWIYQGF
jgi:hypothetical protein